MGTNSSIRELNGSRVEYVFAMRRLKTSQQHGAPTVLIYCPVFVVWHWRVLRLFQGDELKDLGARFNRVGVTVEEVCAIPQAHPCQLKSPVRQGTGARRHALQQQHQAFVFVRNLPGPETFESGKDTACHHIHSRRSAAWYQRRTLGSHVAAANGDKRLPDSLRL